MENMVNFNWSNLNIKQDEAAGRGAQIRYMLGIKDDAPITAEQLMCMKDNAEKLVGQDDNVQAFLNSITDFDAAADWLSRNSYSIGAAMTLLGIIKHPKGWMGL